MARWKIVIKFAVMAELNEYECEMLDAMLEAFGVRDMLTRGDLMLLFDEDEAAAFAMVNVLARENFVAEVGKHGDYELPDKLVLKPKGEKFLKEGGFGARYAMEQRKPAEAGGTLAKLQQQNFRLQNEKLDNESTIRNLQKKIGSLQKLQYLWWMIILIAFVAGYCLAHVIKH